MTAFEMKTHQHREKKHAEQRSNLKTISAGGVYMQDSIISTTVFSIQTHLHIKKQQAGQRSREMGTCFPNTPIIFIKYEEISGSSLYLSHACGSLDTSSIARLILGLSTAEDSCTRLRGERIKNPRVLNRKRLPPEQE
jgi:hypothetical protein